MESTSLHGEDVSAVLSSLSLNNHTQQTFPPGSSSKPTLLSTFAIYPIFDTLCSFMDIKGLIELQKVSKEFAANLAIHRKERWNVNKKLTRFVRDPIKLRSLLGLHDALISGSFVLQFLDGVVWKESDLDIYVEDGMGAKALDHFLKTEGYKLESSKRTDTDGTGYMVDEIIKARIS